VNDFEAFVESCYGDVLRSVALAIGDESRAEDSVQEAFARAYRRWSSVSAMERPVTWVYVVAMNANRKEWRREARRIRHDPEPEAIGDHSDQVIATVALGAALEGLTSRQRSAIVLRYLADLPTKDVAQVLGCAEGTAKATLHQALRKLRVDLGRDATDEGIT
jgi:RNA polymerase sigma-70 factor (ECF subfamily)